MSANINNREAQQGSDPAFRKERLKEIILRLHQGHTVEDVQAEFAKHFGHVSSEEISQVEQALMDEGMAVEEVQRLCDVHAAVFRGSITDAQEATQREHQPGHPVHTLMEENKALRALMADITRRLDAGQLDEQTRALAAQLIGIDTHYKVKENLYFPFLEKYGVQGPPKVMWGVDDEIRAEIKAALAALELGQTGPLHAAMVRVEDMIFKEENILTPLMLEKLTLDEWRQIADDTPEVGYYLIDPAPAWKGNEGADAEAFRTGQAIEGKITLPTGAFTAQELTALLNTLPVDITFVDKDNKVRYFSRSEERVFTRTLTVLGRDVSNCHPPASVHVVEQIVEDFRSGKKDNEDFWIQMGDKLIMIRFFAVRSPEGEYLGVLETTQNIAPLKLIEGEKRLMDSAN